MQHSVADGTSGIHFINSWANTARGLNITIPPHLDRTILCARNPPTPAFPHVEFQPLPSMKTSSTNTTIIAVNIFKLTRAQLDRLKSTLNSTYSTYVTITAHIWRITCLARDLKPDQVTQIHCATDGRKRLCPPLPDAYLGNVVFHAAPMSMVGELASSMQAAAEKIRAALARMDDEYLRSALDYVETEPDKGSLVGAADLYGCLNLRVTSWMRMGIHDADFGWGRPVFMGPSGMLYEGLAFVLPSLGDDGSVSVAISLQAEHMDRFKKMFYDF